MMTIITSYWGNGGKIFLFTIKTRLMRKLKKISLVSLSKDELKKRELSQLIGGQNCCVCHCSGPMTISDGGRGQAWGYVDPWGGYGNGAF